MLSDELTVRELQALALAADGLPNPKIAVRMSVSEPTVASHVRNARVKLRARNRTHAVAVAIRRGLL